MTFRLPFALVIGDGALLAAAGLHAIAQVAAGGERSALISILAGMAGTGAVLMVIGAWLARSHLTFRDSTLVQMERDRAAVDTKLQIALTALSKEIADALRGVVDSNERRHQDNLGAIGALRGEVQPLVYAIAGLHGQPGLLERDQHHQRRRHDQGNQIQAIALLLGQVADVLETLCKAQNVAFDADTVAREVAEIRRVGRRESEA